VSLIITALKPEFVVQLSDMRLTDLSTLAIRNEEQRKATVLCTADARLAVGWCGFACDRHNLNNTGDWLMDVLPQLASRQPPLRFDAVVNELVTSATLHFQSITEPQDSKACSIVMAGWVHPAPDVAVPLAARLSNCEDEEGQRMSHVCPTFNQQWFCSSRNPTTRPFATVIVSGAEQATTQDMVNAVGLLLRRAQTPTEVMNVCLRLMRDAAAHPVHGGLIGRNWVGIEMRRDDPAALAHYFPEHASPEEFMPNLVTPQMAYKDVRIWTGPSDPPWWKHYVAFGLPLFRATVIVWIPMAVFIKDSLKWTDQIRSCPKWMWKTALAFGLYGIFIAVLQAVFPQGDSFSEQALTVSGFPLGFDAIALCILCSVLRSDCMEKSEVVRRATLSIVLATVGVILFLAYRAGYLHHLGPTE